MTERDHDGYEYGDPADEQGPETEAFKKISIVDVKDVSIEKLTDGVVQSILRFAYTHYPHLEVQIYSNYLLDLAENQYKKYRRAQEELKNATIRQYQALMANLPHDAATAGRETHKHQEVMRMEYEKYVRYEIGTIHSRIIEIVVSGSSQYLVDDFYDRISFGARLEGVTDFQGLWDNKVVCDITEMSIEKIGDEYFGSMMVLLGKPLNLYEE